jgi:hypothetical protein
MTQPEYVALRTINFNGVPAYHAGDPVHAAALPRLRASEEDGDVAPADSNEAQALLRALAAVTGDSDVPALDQLRAAQDAEGVITPGSAGTFDPRQHTVSEVNDYLADQSDAEKARVIDAERSSQGRNGIVDGPHAKAAAAVPAVSAPVRGEIAEA